MNGERLPPAAQPLRQLDFLSRVHQLLLNDGVDNVEALRQQLRRALVVDTHELARLDEAHLIGGYNRLVFVFIVLAQANVALGWPASLTRESLRSIDAWAARNGVLALPGGCASLACASMRELERAADVLLWRLRSLDSLDERYIDALEQRASEFVTSAVTDDADYDVPRWRAGAARSSRVFAATSVWWLATLRRAHEVARLLALPTSYVPEQRVAQVRRNVEAPAPLRSAFIDELRALARRMVGDDRVRAFRALAHDIYAVAPGELALHTRIFGLGGAERASVLEVVARTRTPSASTWLARRRYKRPLAEWIEAALERAARPERADGGIGSERAIEVAALVHLVDAQLSARRYAVPFVEWFVVMAHVGDTLERVHRALAVGLPFVVESLGVAYVVVPPAPQRDELERALECDGGVDVLVLGARTMVDALALWARAMLVGWRGRIEHANKDISAFLRTLVEPQRDAASMDDVASAFYFHS